MAEKKLGPNVTYTPDDENDKTPVTMGGVTFVPGESVNLEEMLGEQEGAKVAKKLAGNRFFKVDGGPDHKAMAEKKAEAEQKQQEAAQRAREEAEKAESEEASNAPGKQARTPVMEAGDKEPKQPTGRPPLPRTSK